MHLESVQLFLQVGVVGYYCYMMIHNSCSELGLAKPVAELSGSTYLRYDTIDDLHWKTDRQSAT